MNRLSQRRLVGTVGRYSLLPRRLWRVIHDSLAGAGCGELVDRTLHPVALATALRRGHLVVIGCPRLQAGHANPENRLRMTRVKPDGRFRCLAQIFGIRTVVDDRKMLVISARVGAGPSDDGEVVVGNFELWRLDDLNVLGPFLRRRDLSDDWVGEEQAAGRGGDRQFEEQSIHRTDPQLLFPWETRREVYGGRALPPYTGLGPMEPGVVRAPAGHRKHPLHRGIE